MYLEKYEDKNRNRLILLYQMSRKIISTRRLADSVRVEIAEGNISFADAARKYSDEKETRTNGGQLFNLKLRYAF